MIKLSAYVLTFNSEKYLKTILDKLSEVADELLVIDSGSTDTTQAIVNAHPLAHFIYHPFENFRDQRFFAEQTCAHDTVMFLDSDEIPDKHFIQSVQNLKNNGLAFEAYTAERQWYALGKKIHSVYPVLSPDRPTRLYNKTKMSFANSRIIHEAPGGEGEWGELEGTIVHHTFETKQELKRKLEHYTDIAAEHLVSRKKNISFYKLAFNPILAFSKWYFSKEGYKDGWTGLILSKYAFDYTRKKYSKARKLK